MNNPRHIKVGAIDVGYGHTKFVVIQDGKNAVRRFPSLALSVNAEEEALGYLSTKSDLRKVKVSSEKPPVWVGPAVISRLSGNSNARELSDEYCLSDNYLAFVRGALTYMNTTQVQVLQLGLPMTTIGNHRAALQRKMTGEHHLIAQNGEVYTCNVKKVVVVGQPVAAISHYMSQPDAPELHGNDRVLLIDFGYFTTDWVVMDSNMDIVLDRSGAETGGMNKVVSTIFEGLAKELGRTLPPSILGAIDTAMSEGKVEVRVRDTMHNFQKHILATDTHAKSFLNAVSSKVGSVQDVRKIVICGGGASFMKRHVLNQFGPEGLVVLDQSQDAIALGLHFLGSVVARQDVYA
jgi:PRTRC genetic system protein D